MTRIWIRRMAAWITLALLVSALQGEAGANGLQPTGMAPEAVAPQDPSSSPQREAVFRVPAEQFAELSFSNRSIIVLRASLVPQDPTVRAEIAHRALERLADEAVTGPVAARSVLRSWVVTVAGRDVFAIVPLDVDPVLDDDLAALKDRTIARVQVALGEAVEARQPARLFWAGVRTIVATALAVLAFLALTRAHRRVVRRLVTSTEKRVAAWRIARGPGLLPASRVVDLTRGLVRVGTMATGAGITYFWLTYVLQQFPLTRPWGEALGGFLLKTVTTLGWNGLQAVPGIFTVIVIFVIARFAGRLITLVFDAIGQAGVEVSGLTGPALVTTRRLVKSLLWLFALVVAYPYLPGSETEAFKGISVLVGLGVSLGSGAIISQVMSGYVVTYGGALRPGEYVRIGEVEGTVIHLGILSTTVRTRRNEEITIPNALVVAGTTVNYSRNAAEGVYVTTKVTIGYDVPWRLVKALLLTAAERTAGVRRDPAPWAAQTDLADFAAEYTLAVCLEKPADRPPVLNQLRAHIQDVFNEQGVQIMCPHYEGDPERPKVVPRARWFATPQKEAPAKETMGT